MAGGNAARTLRQEGYDGPITLIGDEPGVPFGRPPLSKTYLRGEEELSGWYVAPPEWYGANGVDVIHATVRRIDTKRRRVEVTEHEALEYSRLLLATGGRNRSLDVPGAEMEGVLQLRTVADCEAIKRAALAGARLLVVGMGFIGCEVSASMRQLGLDVTAAWPGKFPLGSVLGDELGEVYAGIHAQEGVHLLPGETVQRFEGAGRIEGAVTRSGARIACDLAVVAVGIQPNVELAQAAGIAVDNGILVDASLRTNVDDVFAAGDVANHLHPLFGRVRVEHYNNAEKQGRAVARAMLGSTAAYDYLHTFWSDQYTHKLEYAGHATRWERFVVRGSLEKRQVVGFYLEGGVLRAAAGLDRGGDPELESDSEMAKAARLVARLAEPAASDLGDESRDLAAL